MERNILFIFALTTVLFSCEKEIIKPVNQLNSAKNEVVGYDEQGNAVFREVTDPDEDEDFEGASN